MHHVSERFTAKLYFAAPNQLTVLWNIIVYIWFSTLNSKICFRANIKKFLFSQWMSRHMGTLYLVFLATVCTQRQNRLHLLFIPRSDHMEQRTLAVLAVCLQEKMAHLTILLSNSCLSFHTRAFFLNSKDLHSRHFVPS